MLERVCFGCNAGNPPDNAFCGQCGATLHENVPQSLVRRTNHALARTSLQLPAHWQRTGKVVALGVATIAAELGMAWLNRHKQQSLAPTRTRQAARVIAVGRRVTETWRNGELTHRTDEQIMWLAPDQPR